MASAPRSTAPPDDAGEGDVAASAARRRQPSARPGRRLSDKILVAFHHACDQHELEIAEQLLTLVETLLRRPAPPADGNRRRSIDSLVAAHERLWHLRHRD